MRRATGVLILLMMAGCAADETELIHPAPPPAPTPIAAMPRQPVVPALSAALAEEIGRSVDGRPIQMHRFGAGDRPVMVIGGIHGSEGNSSVCAVLLVKYLQQHGANGVPVVVIPAANPDGLAKNQRTNSHRVDLNRNFPAKNWVAGSRWPYSGGKVAGGEPETMALMRTIERLRPRRILTIHSIVGEACNNYDGPGEGLARAMAAHNRYAVKASIGYPTPGSLGAWAGIDRQIPTITLELKRETRGEAGWEQNREAILAFIRADQ